MSDEKEERYKQDMREMGISEYKVIPIPNEEEDKYEYKVVPPSDRQGLTRKKADMWKAKLNAIEKMVTGVVLAVLGVYLLWILLG